MEKNKPFKPCKSCPQPKACAKDKKCALAPRKYGTDANKPQGK